MNIYKLFITFLMYITFTIISSIVLATGFGIAGAGVGYIMDGYEKMAPYGKTLFVVVLFVGLGLGFIFSVFQTFLDIKDKLENKDKK